MTTFEGAVCSLADLSPGELKQVNLGDRKILLARQGEQIYALAAHCSHLGAPLVQGVLSQACQISPDSDAQATQDDDLRVICPWHNACFSLKTGQQLEPPGLDNLARYESWLRNGQIYVRIVSDLPEQLPPPMVPLMAAAGNSGQQNAKTSQGDRPCFVIVGAGAAGSAAAETLRSHGFAGHLLLLTQDSTLPYDRTALSKSYLQQDKPEQPMPKRSAAFYQERGIELWTHTTVQSLDTDRKQLQLENGDRLTYDRLLLATGSKVRQLDLEGAALKNIYSLHGAEDAWAIAQKMPCAKQAVVIGASFIGMEVASSLRQRGIAVTVICSDEVPFEKILGHRLGLMFQQLHEEHGVEFWLKTRAAAFKGQTSVEGVVLDNGEILDADLVIAGIGVSPAVDYAPDLPRSEDGGLRVDAHLQVVPDVFVAGDIASYANPETGQRQRIEHWRLAMQQGRLAARNMLGAQQRFESVPFFWTGQFDFKLRYVGHAEDWDEVVIQGDLPARSFLAFYLQGGRITAVAGGNRDREIAAISELMRLQQMPDATTLTTELDIDWVAQLTQMSDFAA